MAKRDNGELLFVFSLVVVLLEFGMIFSFGALFVSLLEKYQQDRSSTATVQSILVGVTLSCGVISGALVTKLGLALVTVISSVLVPVGFGVSFFATRLEHLYVTIGMVSGIGISMGYISAVVAVSRLFTGQKRVLYLAVQTAAVSLSGLIYPYVLDWLVGLYGLNGTFLILGALCCNKFPFVILCLVNRTSLSLKKSSKAEKDTEIAPQEDMVKHNKQNFLLEYIDTFKEMMNKTYFLLLLASGISIAGVNGFMGLILDISVWKGFSNSQGLFTFVVINITNTLSRLVPGMLNQKKGVDSFIYPVVSTVAGCIGQLLFYFGNSYAVYIIGTCLTGAGVGGVVSSQLILVTKIVRPECIPVASGLLLTATGVISVATGPIFGMFRDSSGSYGIVVLTIGAIQAIAAILFAIAFVYRRIDNAKKKAKQAKRRNTVFSITVSQF